MYRSLFLAPALVLISCCGLAAQAPGPAVTPDPSVAAPGPVVTEPDASDDASADTPKLTPEQEREQRIRKADLTAKDEDAPRTAAEPSGTANTPQSKPLAGSVADSHRSTSLSGARGPEVSGDTNDTTPEPYTGPAVLSRSYSIGRPGLTRNVRWSPTFGVSSQYATGLTGGSVQPNGTLASANSTGVRANWGLSGRHLWHKDAVAIDYGGDYNHYTGADAYGGTNQKFDLSWQHEFSRHLRLNLNQTLAAYSQSYTLENPALSQDTSVANINIAASPLVQVLDNGFRQASTSASVIWQKSARLSFNFGGGYFGVVRNGAQLIGNTGYTATSDVNYRLTRKTTVGAYYSFSKFQFSHNVQLADTNTIGLIYSYAFSKSTEFRLRFGGTQLESQGLQTVPLSPAIAALLGVGGVVVDAYNKHLTSDISAEFARDFGRTRTARIAYARGISPGNGLQLTSTQESFSAGFNQAVFRRNQLSLGIGRTNLNTAAQSIGSYKTDYASLSLSHQFARGLAQTLTVYYRTYTISNTGIAPQQPQLSLTLGFSWNPGDNAFHF